MTEASNPVAPQAVKLIGICHGLSNQLRHSIPVLSTTGKLIIPADLTRKYGVRSPRYSLSALSLGDNETCIRAFQRDCRSRFGPFAPSTKVARRHRPPRTWRYHRGHVSPIVDTGGTLFAPSPTAPLPAHQSQFASCGPIRTRYLCRPNFDRLCPIQILTEQTIQTKHALRECFRSGKWYRATGRYTTAPTNNNT